MRKPPFCCPPFLPMTEWLTPAQGKKFALQKFEVTESQARLQQVLDVRSYGRMEEGEYMRLVRLSGNSERVIMSDTPNERMWGAEAVRWAHGEVLIAGLGIGMVLTAIAVKPGVDHIFVVELEQEVIDLTWNGNLAGRLPRNVADKVTMVWADIHQVIPDKHRKFNTIYFDIWDEVSTDDLPEMTTLRRRFASMLVKRKIDPDAWASCWRQEDMQDNRRRGL